MPNYEKLYCKLFNAISDTIAYLQKIQIDAEEAYINYQQEEIKATENDKK